MTAHGVSAALRAVCLYGAAAALLGGSICSVAAGEIRTLAGTGVAEFSGDDGHALAAGVGAPFGIVLGPDGALYICEVATHVVRCVELSSGRIRTIAGTGGRSGFAGDGGPADQALLNEPYEVRFDAAGHLYVVEMQNAVVRRVDARTGILSTVAGTGTPGYSGDGGPASQAQLRQPHAIEVLGDELFICDIGNHRVRRVDLQTGLISTFAGTGDTAATRTGAPFAETPLHGPRALAIDYHGRVHLALREGHALWRFDRDAGLIDHVAGTGVPGYAGDGGPARLAQLSGPKGLACSPRGDLYVADTESHTIRVVRAASGIIETVVGDGMEGDGPDGDPRRCRLSRPHGVFVDEQGRLFIGDSGNHKVRMLSLD